MLAARHMRMKRLALWGMIVALALLATGCEWARWMRLLSFKNQLAKLERYVQVEDQGGLRLRLLKPVVYADDLSLLINGETARTTNGNQITWLWSYEKQSAGSSTEIGDFGMSLTMSFKDQKLSELELPERFLALMPKPLVLGPLRSVGQAEVDLKHGGMKMKWVAPTDKGKVELPTKAQITAQLGEPFMSWESNGLRTVVYKYYQKAPKPCSPAERLAWGRFTFAGADEQVISSEGVIGNVAWSLTRVAGQPEPRVTFRLTPMSVEPVALKLPSEVADQYVGQYQEPGGMRFNLGRDGASLVASWSREQTGGWCAVAAETTNAFFGLPTGEPGFTFLRDSNGMVTGLMTHLQGGEKRFTRCANQLPPGPVVASIDPRVYPACAGVYKASWAGLIIISRQGEQLFWQNHRVQSRIPLYPASETNFFFKVVDSPVTFVRNDKGEVTRLILHYCGSDKEAVKLPTKR
jgi:hypothetical protein